MMSGPAPAFAATAAFGRTSSQLSLSTRTWMPYFSVNFLTLTMYWSIVALDEALPAQHAQLGALFRRVGSTGRWRP